MSSLVIFKIAAHVSIKDSSEWTLSSPEISADAAQSDEIHTVDLGMMQVSKHFLVNNDSPYVCVTVKILGYHVRKTHCRRECFSIEGSASGI